MGCRKFLCVFFKVSYISIPWRWNFSCVILYLSDSTIRTSIFTQLLLINADCVVNGICLKRHTYFYSVVLELFVLFYIYPIVLYAPAFLHSFLLLLTIINGIYSKRHTYFYSVVLEFFLCYSTSIR